MCSLPALFSYTLPKKADPLLQFMAATLSQRPCTPGYPTLCSDAIDIYESQHTLHVCPETCRNQTKGRIVVSWVWCVAFCHGVSNGEG